MQEPILYSRHHLQIDQEDLQALDLFNNLQHEFSKSQQPIQPNQQLHEQHHSQDDHPQLNKLSKLKHSSKKQKKHKKLQQKHRLKKKKHRNFAEMSSPKKKIKRDKSQKKQKDQEEQVQQRDEDKGSSEFHSSSNNSDDINNELRNLNPNYALNEQDRSPKKRLIKSGRKQRIQQKQGFKIQQLGNDGQFHLSNQSDESFDGQKRKRLKTKKLKMRVPTNQQIMNAFKQHGVLESEGDDEVGKDRQYDSGLDMLHSLKSKKSSNGIRINNRLFGDLQMNLQKQQVQMAIPQNLQFELKPKVSVSSQRFSFLSRAETIKKQRGLEADVNHQQFQRRAQEKAKKSMAKVVSSMVSQEFHDDIDVQIRVPTIARGKSAGIINNTVFLRKFASKFQGNQVSPQPQVHLVQNKYLESSNIIKKDIQTRSNFFKQILQQNRLRRSKYISQEELKNSFKKTNLEELEQARKRIQEKKKKQVLSDESDNQQEIDSNLQQMIEKQQMICGDIQQPEQQEEQQSQQLQAQQGKINVQVQLVKIPQDNVENKQAQASEKDLQQNQNQELQQYNEVIQQHQSVSEDQEEISSEQNERQEQSEVMQNEDEVQYVQQDHQQQEQVNKAEIVPQQDKQQNQENERLMRQLQEEGIINRKRGVNKPKIIQQNHIENWTPAKYFAQNEEKDIPQDKHNVQLVSTDKKFQYQQNEQFNEFRKLRKIAFVMAKKKKQREQGRQYAAQFIQHEAQEGSDNQEHDDFIKKIDYDAQEKQFEGIDLDADLAQLIDNAVDLNEEDQNQAFRKYLQDIRQKDREEIRKIIRGEFHKKHQDLQFEMEQDQKRRLERMQEVRKWMEKKEQEQGQNLYLKQPEPQQINSQDQSQDFYQKKKNKVQQEQQQQKVDDQEEQARLEKFLSQTMPTSKKELKPVKELNFLPIPESVKFQKRPPSNQKSISMSKLGSKVVSQINSQQLFTRKNTSSLVNKILNKSSQFKPNPFMAVTTKPMKKK